MGNSLRCCLACVLPCGALDVIRIVHLNGHVDEITRSVTAGEILEAHPSHVLSKPCSSQGVARRILILSPESELKRGSIYFLIPASSLPEKKRGRDKKSSKARKKRNADAVVSADCERYLTEIAREKKHTRRSDHRSCRAGVWRPHLESISEDL
ncbi:uncharacterized protein LOC131148758 [Malania oleifera]|uniref:uncharacterized protein LOC131148758 n=1 Tax=Malania oleifera TaxID=397392 RepID=UPI0025ADAB87|nr:uncharacterized protein LOC131148758 [Malania oleifera]